jgi:hypothetical protein
MMQVILFSCKKNDCIHKAPDFENDPVIINGVATFKTIKDYVNAAENIYGRQKIVIEKLQLQNFASLKNIYGSYLAFPYGKNALVNTFNPDLYTNWLLHILNQDKICCIDGYWIKIDLEKGFCAALDAEKYKDEFEDIKDNVFTNGHILRFDNEGVPVLEVLDSIRQNQLQGKDERLKYTPINVAGACTGTGTASNISSVPVYSGGALIMSIARYRQVFIQFELAADGYVNGAGIYDDITLTGKYEFVGLCNGSGAASFYLGPANNWAQSFIAYSGVTPLKIAKIEVTAISVNHGPGRKASIGY